MASLFSGSVLRSTASITRRPWVLSLLFCLPGLFLGLASGGCSDDAKVVRSIQAGRQIKQQAETKVDHLGEAFGLISGLVELERESANRQILYHLNAWQQSHARSGDEGELPLDLLKTVSDVMPLEASRGIVTRPTFAESDVDVLKLRYLFRQIAETVRAGEVTDTLWSQWIENNRQSFEGDAADQLAIAVRLFDWTIRNIALEPLVPTQPGPTPRLPLGMTFGGAGYRQTPFQTLFRGTGDAWQRSGTFMGLCRQADLPACLLASAPSADSSDTQPRSWLVGVLIGGEVYLFDCGLGLPVIGPGQEGIATLAQARRDPAVLRRMNVPGWFDYPFQRDDIQQCVAMLMVEPESLAFRASRLQDSLTGDLRLGVYDHPATLATAFTAVAGIASVAIWDKPLLARVYQTRINEIANQDPAIFFYINAPWTILEADFDQAKRLALGRWRHLKGQLEGNPDEGFEGAKLLYLSQRQPEFEIEDLRFDVELQKRYGIRRELGMSSEIFDRQVQQIQAIMRQGKITATYWLSLIQYDTARIDLARTWFQDRILGDGFDSNWEIAARYNLARSLESLGETQRAVELYKTEGDTQEHGNRIRARLVGREPVPASDTGPESAAVSPLVEPAADKD